MSESPLKDRVLALQFSPDGRVLASGGGEPSRGGEVLFWDVFAPRGTQVDAEDVRAEIRRLDVIRKAASNAPRAKLDALTKVIADERSPCPSSSTSGGADASSAGSELSEVGVA